MAAAIPTCEPTSIIAGDTVKWTRRLSGEFAAYSAADGWVLKYAFRGASKLDVTATTDTDGAGFAVTIPAGDTGSLIAGQYRWIGWVEYGGENFTVLEGVLLVSPNLKTANAGDLQSSAERELTLVETQIAELLASANESYSIAQRSATKRALKDLYVTRGILIAKLGRQRGQRVPARAVVFNAAR